MKLFFLFLIVGNTSLLLAQKEEDSVNLRYPIHNPIDPTQEREQSFDLGQPSNVEKSIKYDPKSGKYIFTEKIGDLDFKRGSMMTLDEYIDYKRKQSLQNYWAEKIESQTKENKPLIPPIKIKSPLFANIFGSNEILIRPQGSVEISLGVQHSRYDNPILPERDRKTTRLDFNQNIQLNLVGQIGTKMKLSASYNTKSSFSFDNMTNLTWTGNEDQILQEVVAGNVSMPLKTSLIRGSQTLFGVRTKLKFGRLTIDALASTSRGKKKEINIKGGAQVKEFKLKADDYEANQHYFLNFYFRNHYDEAMKTVPVINSLVHITKIEVWVTNDRNDIKNTRNILAFTDLGEADPTNWQGNPGNPSSDKMPDNDANGLYKYLTSNAQIRSFNNAVIPLESQATSPGPFRQSEEYEKIENARMLTDKEYTYNSQLGFISLNMPLNSDEVLAVAYQYTYQGRTYQVGEFSTDGIVGTNALFLKLLKPTITNPHHKTWDLMMKNIYSLGAYQLSKEGFRLNIMYDNPQTSLLVNFLPYPGVDKKQIIELVGMDRLNQNNRAQKDGVFDFMPIQFSGNESVSSGTINVRNGRIYFSTVEPFGQTLHKKLVDAGLGAMAGKISFEELYDSTKVQAKQIPKKNRFYFVGQYESKISDEIPLNVLNVPKGSVVVTAGGIRLQEGVDYVVDYNLGRVKILNEGILASNADIKISIESNSVFGFQNKSMMGTHFNYMINPDFNIGATWMRMAEKPITQKVDIGQEPYANNVVGFDLSYKTDLPFLTKLINFIPTISTRQMSTLTVNAEAAYLIPGSPRAITRKGISYVDDFEGSQSEIDLTNYTSWRLASVPHGQPTLFPNANIKDDLSAGYKRSRLSWYVIDYSTFQSVTATTPKNIADNPAVMDNMNVSYVSKTDIFPNKDPSIGERTNLPTFDLTFRPKERGMYNYDTTNMVDANGRFTDPQDRWGGIMRALSTTNFERSNIGYIEFWLLDPFNSDQEKQNPNTNYNGGELYFNLGNLSEDILPDARKSFESGLPADYSTTNNIDHTNWARISTKQTVINAFDNDPNTREQQDVGLDGYSDKHEKTAYPKYVNWIKNSPILSQATKDSLLADVSSDNYTYYRDDRYDQEKKDIRQRYKYYNGMEGNSPTPEMSKSINSQGYPTQSTNRPDIEDINGDNNLSETESYYQYKVSLRKGDMNVGENYIINTREYDKGTKHYKWYQFRIPVHNPDKVVNGISGFRSIRFMRIFMKGFEEMTTLRFAKLYLVRNDWREFEQSLNQPTDGVQTDPDLTSFHIGEVDIVEDDQRTPVHYVVPPGIQREIDPSQQYQRQLNEQSMTLTVCGLKDGDARAATKVVDMDMLKYKNLEMYIHAEMVDKSKPIKDNDIVVFVRLGTDFKENYYEYDVPVKITKWGATSDLDIWPEENNMRVVFQQLIDLKKERNKKANETSSGVSLNTEYSKAVEHQNGDADNNNVDHPKRMIRIKGNPNLTDVKVLMIGVRNPSQHAKNPWKPDDGLDKCVNVWVNELRLTEFDNKGGGAALAKAELQIADFANVRVSGSYSGQNWGALDSRVSERQRDTRLNLDLSVNAQLGQLLGKKARIDIPFLYSYSVGTVTPKYDPYNPDIRLSEYKKAVRKEKIKAGQEFNERRSFNFTNVRWRKPVGAEDHIWSPSNLSFDFSYSEELHRDFNTNYDRTKLWKGGFNYVYNGSPTLWKPFENWKKLKNSKWGDILRTANLYLGPKSITIKNMLRRSYNERQIRNNIPNTNFEFQPIYLKNFSWDKSFGFQYDITRNLKVNFMANNNSIFDEPMGQIDKDEAPNNYREFKDSIRSQMRTLGKTMRYHHNYDISYRLPLDKIPALDFINSNVQYSASYEWSRSNLGMEAFGNTIQNSRQINATAQLNMLTLYKKWDFLKRVIRGGSRGSIRRSISQRGRSSSGGKPKNDSHLAKKVDKLKKKQKALENLNWEKLSVEDSIAKSKELDKVKRKLAKKEPRLDRQNERIEKRTEQRERNMDKYGTPYHPVVGFLAHLLMSVHNISGSYSQNDGILLPGFNQTPLFFGSNSRMISDRNWVNFALGAQRRNVFGKDNGNRFATYAGQNSYLVDTSGLNTQHTVIHSQNYNIKVSLEPIKDLRIDLSMSRQFTQNFSDFYRFSDSLNRFTSQGKYVNTTLNYTTISLGSAFQSLDKNYRSKSFDNLRKRRREVSEYLGKHNPHSGVDSAGYYDGYGPSQQSVLIGAFLNTYRGSSTNGKSINPIRNIPLPNWRVSYNGLSKLGFFKDFVQNFTIRHAYSSSVTISGMQTNLKSQQDANGNLTARNLKGNFIPSQQIQNVTVSERFSPLIGLDATWNVGGNGLITKFAFNKERTASLSLANNQVTVTTGSELVIGAGYKFTNFRLPIKFRGNMLKPSDLNIRVDLSIRDNLTVIRKIVENTTQATAGQKVFSLRGTIDYNATKNITVSLYYQQQLNTPKIATSYVTGNISSGIRLRFNLGGLN